MPRKELGKWLMQQPPPLLVQFCLFSWNHCIVMFKIQLADGNGADGDDAAAANVAATNAAASESEED